MIKEIVQILMALITRVEKHCPLATDTLNTVQRVFFKFMCACVCVSTHMSLITNPVRFTC